MVGVTYVKKFAKLHWFQWETKHTLQNVDDLFIHMQPFILWQSSRGVYEICLQSRRHNLSSTVIGHQIPAFAAVKRTAYIIVFSDLLRFIVAWASIGFGTCGIFQNNMDVWNNWNKGILSLPQLHYIYIGTDIERVCYFPEILVFLRSWQRCFYIVYYACPDSTVHGANMGRTWAPCWPYEPSYLGGCVQNNMDGWNNWCNCSLSNDRTCLCFLGCVQHDKGQITLQSNLPALQWRQHSLMLAKGVLGSHWLLLLIYAERYFASDTQIVWNAICSLLLI